MPITINGNGAISGLGDIDGHDLETATLVVSGDTTIAPQAVGRASLFIDDDANSVGINTTTPASGVFLEVADGTDPIVSLNNTGNGEVRLGCNASTGYIGTESNHNFVIETNSTERITIANTGNVGINTTSPAYTLDITKNFVGDNALAVFNNINSGTVAKASLKVGYDSNNHLEIYRLGGAAPIYYDTKQSSSTHNFLIAGNGVFAISNSLPISATSNANRYAVFNTTNTASAYIGFQSQSTPYLDLGHNDQLYSSDAGEGDGGGINSRPGYSLSLGSGNNCKVYIPGSSVAPLKLTSNCTGIDFSEISSTGTGTVSSNTLDDYEEGTWTPTFAFGTWTYSTQQGMYTIVGDVCTASFLLAWSAKSGTGQMEINLPFITGGGVSDRFCVSYGYIQGVDTDGNKQLIGTVNGNGLPRFAMYYLNDNNPPSITLVQNASATGQIQASITYQIA